MKTGLVSIGGKQLFVEDTEADKPPMILIHGLGGTTTFYDPLVPALSEHVRLVRFDLDGHGRSPRSATPLSITSLVDDVAALLETLPGKKAHVMAHSMGTLVAQELAARRPELVASLVLLGPVRAQAEAAKTATRARAVTVREKGMAAVADTIAQNATSAEARAENPLVAGFVRELLLGQDAESYAQACEALANAENPDLSRVAAPTLLLVGTDDKVSSEPVREELTKGLANARIATTAKCGHWTALEAPGFVLAQTTEFLKTNRL